MGMKLSQSMAAGAASASASSGIIGRAADAGADEIGVAVLEGFEQVTPGAAEPHIVFDEPVVLVVRVRLEEVKRDQVRMAAAPNRPARTIGLVDVCGVSDLGRGHEVAWDSRQLRRFRLVRRPVPEHARR